MASCSSGPSAASSTSVPWLAASIITCMMLRASTSRPLARSVILLSNRDAVVTSLLVARACSPSLLMMVMGRQIMAASDLPPGLQVWQFGVAYLHVAVLLAEVLAQLLDRKSTRLNSSHVRISYAVFCLKKKKKKQSTMN